MLGGPDWSPAQLKEGLQEWLRLTVQDPASLLVERTAHGTPLFYNGNMMRLSLMSFYGCQAARGVGRLEPTLPQLLLGSGASSSVTVSGESVLRKDQALKLTSSADSDRESVPPSKQRRWRVFASTGKS
jgi:hypothetical protein